MTDRESFKFLVRKWSKRLKVSPRQIRVQRMTRKWGSCSTLGYVSFAEDLLDQPPDFREFVIVHELLHLRIPNHGRLFHQTLKAHFPRANILEKKLRDRKLTSGEARAVKSQ